jgi:hypothetical protein
MGRFYFCCAFHTITPIQIFQQRAKITTPIGIFQLFPPKIHLTKCHIVTAIFYCGGVFWLSKHPKIVSIIPKTGPPRRKMSKIWGFEEPKETRQKSGKS